MFVGLFVCLFVFSLVTSIIFLFVILSTAFGYYYSRKDGKVSESKHQRFKSRNFIQTTSTVTDSPLTKLGLSFCVNRNFQKLFSADGSNPALNILYGMRVFCICMIIIDHRFGTHLSSAVLNFNIVEEVTSLNILYNILN